MLHLEWFFASMYSQMSGHCSLSEESFITIGASVWLLACFESNKFKWNQKHIKEAHFSPKFAFSK